MRLGCRIGRVLGVVMPPIDDEYDSLKHNVGYSNPFESEAKKMGMPTIEPEEMSTLETETAKIFALEERKVEALERIAEALEGTVKELGEFHRVTDVLGNIEMELSKANKHRRDRE